MKTDKINDNKVLLIGRPNVGKSTIFNSLIPDNYFSAVSPKKNTTTNSIIISSNMCTWIDIPGIVEDNKFQQLVEKQILLSKLILFITESNNFTEIDQKILNIINKSLPKDSIIFWILNKIDLVKNKQELLETISSVSNNFSKFNEIIPIYAYKKEDLEKLIKLINNYLNTKIEIQKSEDISYNQNNIYTEVIKSKIYLYTNKEVPYSTKIDIERIEKTDNFTYVYANIIVTKHSHKKLLIGFQGKKIKQIRESTELLLKKRLKRKVKLKLWIKIK